MSLFKRLFGRSDEGQASDAEFENLIAESEAYLSQNRKRPR
jgi:hypothetical protein